MTIKLKLSLSGAQASSAPSGSSSHHPLTSRSRKGKEKAVDLGPDHDGSGSEAQRLPTIRLKQSVSPLQSTHPLPALSPDPLDSFAPGPQVSPPKRPPASLLQTPAAVLTTRSPAKRNTSTPRPSHKKAGARRPVKLSKIPKSATSSKKQTSAIPPHVLSATPTPRQGPSPLPSTPDPVNGISPVTPSRNGEIKSEPLDTPSEDGQGPFTPVGETNESSLATPDTAFTPNGEFDTPGTATRSRTGGAVKRLKKPLKELIAKIIAELRKKDDYALFEDPVDLDQFPDYLQTVGGEENMMDISSMQSKMENGAYRNIDQVEADLRLLVKSAQTFNPAGTVPHREAGKILVHGLKQIEKARPIVATPSPSPERGSASRAQSTFSGREMTAVAESSWKEEISPYSYIPTEMLNFAPNSLEALAVGWNLNGGKKAHTKRIVRTRERFNGKWRHWGLDGTRDLAEMEEIEEVFGVSRNNTVVDCGARNLVDWSAVRKSGTAWWDDGHTGQPPIAFATFPRPPLLKRRRLFATDFGNYPNIETEAAAIPRQSGEANFTQVLSEHLRPMRPKPIRFEYGNYVNIYDGVLGREAKDWLRDVEYGGVQEEAYVRSVEAFVQGAMRSRRRNEQDNMVKMEESQDETIPLDEWVKENYHGGVLVSTVDKISRNTCQILQSAKSKSTKLVKPTSSVLSLERLDQMARRNYQKLSLRQIFTPRNMLDLAEMIRTPTDFSYSGMMDKGTTLPSTLKYVGSELARVSSARAKQRLEADLMLVHGKRKLEEEDTDNPLKKLKMENTGLDSTASSPLSQAPPLPEEDTTLPDSLRMELIALMKCYPVSALKKWKRADAERLLPSGVWHLLSPLPQNRSGQPTTARK